MATGYADFNVDPATGLKRRIMQSLDPNAPAVDPSSASPAATSGAQTEAAPFVQPITSSPTEGIPPSVPFGDPNAPAPQIGPPPVTLGDPNAPPPQPGPVPSMPRVAVPTQEYSLAGGTSDAQTQNNSAAGSGGGTTGDPNSVQWGNFSYDDLNALYTKHLKRSASQDEYQNWLKGMYGATDLAGIEKQIASSGEAQNVGGAPSGGSAPSGGTGGSGDPGAYLLSLLQSGMDREQAIAQTSQKFGLQQGQDGYPLYYANNNTIGLKGSYLANVNGQWNQVQRGPEGGSGGAPAAAGSPANDTYSKFLEQLMNDRNASAAQRDQVRQMIMDRLKLAGQPVNENDIGISQPLSAARDEVQRSQQTERTALAERLYAQGGGGLQSGALTQQIQQSAERNAGGLSQLRAGLITSQLQQKQQEMQSLLQMALASGDTQSAQLLQAQIAALSAQVNREGLGVNLAEFLANLNKSTVSAGGGV